MNCLHAKAKVHMSNEQPSNPTSNTSTTQAMLKQAFHTRKQDISTWKCNDPMKILESQENQEQTTKMKHLIKCNSSKRKVNRDVNNSTTQKREST